MREIVSKYERNLEFLASKSILNETPPPDSEIDDFFASLAPQVPLVDERGAPVDKGVSPDGFTFQPPEDSDESEGHAGGWRHSSPMTILLKKVRRRIHRRQSSDEERMHNSSLAYRDFIFPHLPAMQPYSPYILDAEALIVAWRHLLGDAISFNGGGRDPFGNIMPRVERVRKGSGNRDEMNLKFRQLHPTIDPSFSLTKLKALKKSLFQLTGRNLEIIDPFISFCAWVYFERLVLTGYVKKKNRRAILGTTMIISHKFRTYMKDESARQTLLKLIEILSSLFLDRSTAFKMEYSVLCHLSFDLRVELKDIGPHLVHFVSSNAKLSFEKACGYDFETLRRMALQGKESLELFVRNASRSDSVNARTTCSSFNIRIEG